MATNPLFYAMNGGKYKAFVDNGFMQMMQQFQQFRQSFKGDPKAEVEKLLQSGAMSQQELNQLQGMAQQFGQLFR